MPRYLYTITARALIRETWAIDSPQPLTSAEVMAVMDEDGDGQTEVHFVSDEVVGDEEDREFEACIGEEEDRER